VIIKSTGHFKTSEPTTVQLCSSETGKFILEDLSVRYCHNSKKYHPSGNLKFNNLGIFQSLELVILMEKNFLISLKLNSTPNTLGCYGLNIVLWLCRRWVNAT